MENMGYWERYLGYIVPRIAGLVDFWNVINEFNLGNQPERVDFKLNMIRYHARAYHIIKHHTAAPVSTAHAFTHYMPARWNDKSDRLMTDLLDFCDHEFFFHAIRTGEILYPFRESALVPEVKGTMDFWSVNAYTRHMVSMRDTMPWGPKAPRFEHKVLKMIPMDFYLEEMYPECLTAGLERLSDKPIYITENGCSCDDDRFRIVYIALHLSAISEAIRKGADVRGYLYWSLMDNYEWGSFKPRFGLVDVDWKTFKRTPKPSAEFYKGIIAENGFSQANLRKFLTELPSLAKPV
jgi:beta-glucosidase